MSDINKIQSEAYRQVEEIRGLADAKATESTQGHTIKVPKWCMQMHSLQIHPTDLAGYATGPTLSQAAEYVRPEERSE